MKFGNVVAAIAVLAVALLAGCRAGRPLASPEEDRLPPEVADHIPAYRSFDRRPYEFIWAERQPTHRQLVDFERLLGWQVTTGDGVQASFGRSQERQLWDDYVGALAYQAAEAGGWALLEPPDPIPIRDPVDSATLWLYGDGWANDRTAAPHVSLILQTAQGELHTVELAAIDWQGWWKVQRRLAPPLLDAAAYPLTLTGIRFDQLPAADDAHVYLDALCLFTESLLPLRYPARPRRNLALREGQLVGVNTGESTLHFPITEWTGIPPVDEGQGRLSLEQRDDGSYDIALQNGVNGITYRMDLAEGLRVAQVLYGGMETGIAFPPIRLLSLNPEDPSPVVVRAEASQLYVEYDRGDVYRISMRGHSLIVDVSYRGREGQGVDWRGMQEAEPLHFPFLNEPGFAVPPVFLWHDFAEPLFVHMGMDPYRSNASSLFYDEAVQPWRIGARYEPTTAGRRNDIHERFIVTVAPRLDDVLPAIPNPSAPRADRLAGRLLVDPADDATGYADERMIAAQWRLWGLDAVVYRMPSRIWRHEDESLSFRLRANPHRGGDATLREFIAQQQEAGWLMALYANYRVISPLNAYWSSDAVTRTSASEWIPFGESSYLVKPLFALSWNNEYASERHERFGAGAAFLDEQTAHPPWTYTDYDRRTPGAATFSQVLYADGDLMREKGRATGGPVLTQAQGAVLYAGLTDGLIVESIDPAWHPYLPIFKLQRVQPLSVTFGAGDPSHIRTHSELDAYLARQIAYGNAGRVGHVPERPEFVVRSYYAMQALQPHYLLHAPKRLMYWTGGGYLNVDEALATGAWKRSQLYAEYPGDLELWVNGSTTEDWSVQVGAVRYHLPESGWVAVMPGLLAFSGLHEGHRIDYVESEDYIYLDPRGHATEYGKLKGAGPLVLRIVDESAYELLDILQTGKVGVHERYPVQWGDIQIACYDDAGNALGPGSVKQDGPWWLLSGPEGTVLYRVYASSGEERNEANRLSRSTYQITGPANERQ